MKAVLLLGLVAFMLMCAVSEARPRTALRAGHKIDWSKVDTQLMDAKFGRTKQADQPAKRSADAPSDSSLWEVIPGRYTAQPSCRCAWLRLTLWGGADSCTAGTPRRSRCPMCSRRCPTRRRAVNSCRTWPTPSLPSSASGYVLLLLLGVGLLQYSLTPPHTARVRTNHWLRRCPALSWTCSSRTAATS